MTHRLAVNRRQLLAGAGAFAAMAPTMARSADPLVINIVNTQGNATVTLQELMRRRGYLTEMGVTPNITYVTDGSKLMGSLLSGENDICMFSGFGQVLTAIEKGAKLKIVAGAVLKPEHAFYTKRADIRSVKDLQGKTIGIVGYGNIGKAVARRAKACLMNVVYYRRQAQPNDPEYRTLEQLLRESDVVSLHTPLTPETYRMINAERLAMMKKGAILINMARGKVCDESAVVKALDTGHLAGAGLDVFENEPEVHPALVLMENVVIPPHVGGGTRESRRASRFVAAQNIALVLHG